MGRPDGAVLQWEALSPSHRLALDTYGTPDCASSTSVSISIRLRSSGWRSESTWYAAS